MRFLFLNVFYLSLIFLTSCSDVTPTVSVLKSVTPFEFESSKIITSDLSSISIQAKCLPIYSSVEISFDAGTSWMNSQQYDANASADCGAGTFKITLSNSKSPLDTMSLASGQTFEVLFRATSKYGDTLELPITVQYVQSLLIQPITVDQTFGGSTTFTASGGVAPYSYSVEIPGAGSVGVSTGVYTAPFLGGSETVRVTDALGNTADAVVTVYEPVQISPSTATVSTNGSLSFTSSGGKSPFTFSVSAGDSSIDGSGYFTAGSTSGSYTVRVTDSLGQFSDAVVTVTPLTIDLSPDSSVIRVGETKVLSLTGGVAPYNWFVSGGGTFDPGTMAYTAPTTPTMASVQVIDSVSLMETVSITVNPGVPVQFSFLNSAQSIVAGSCSGAVSAQLKDFYGNDTVTETSLMVSLSGSGLSFYSDSSCTTGISSMSLASGSGSFNFYFTGTAAGLKTMFVSASGLSLATQTATILSGPPSNLSFSPSTVNGTAGYCTPASTLQIIDAYGNLAPLSNSYLVTLVGAGVSFYSDAGCSLGLGNSFVLSNSWSSQEIYFQGAVNGNYTVTATASGLISASASLTLGTGANDYSQTFASLPSFVPHDGLAVATALIIPKEGAANLGPGKIIEITSSSPSTSFLCNGGACAACEVSSPRCVKAFDSGNGAYLFEVKNTVPETVSFAIKYKSGSSFINIKNLEANFNTANFAVISSNTTLTSTNQGQNLYVTAGTVTFDASTVGKTFGDVFFRSGVITHSATSTSVVNKLDVNVNSLTIQTGTINVNSLGYVVGYSFGATAPATGLAATSGCGGSHGGRGYGSCTGAAGQPFGDYRDPQFPGGGAAAGGTGVGGGVIRIQSAQTCVIKSGALIMANGISSGAGGSIKLSCAGFAGDLAPSSLQANGGAANPTGGGGRISLISTQDQSSFAGNFLWPSDSVTMTNFLSRIQALGGRTGSIVGGAGTIFLKHSGLDYGGLIVDNGGASSVLSTVTELPSLAKTVSSVSGSLIVMTSLNSGYVNLFKNMRLRTDIGFTNGTPNELLDDNVVTITSNDATSVTVSGSFSTSAGATLRTLEVLDYLSVSGSSVLATASDIVVKSGNFVGPSLIFSNGLLDLKTSNIVVPAVASVALENGTYSGLNYSGTDLVVRNTASLNYTGQVSVDNLKIEGGTYTATTTSVTNDLEILAGTNSSKITNIGRDFKITGGVNTFSTVSVGRNFEMSAGTLKHPATTTTVVYKLEMTVGSNFTLSGGSINLTGLGYLAGYSWGPSLNVPATQIGGGSPVVGGSHGGRGGGASSVVPGLTYDDYAMAQYPGAGGGTSGNGNSGGGYVKVTASGLCQVNSPGMILANGSGGMNGGGAGGTILMMCSGFAGTATASSIKALGGSSSSGSGGGGGRIALISSGDENSFGGNFAFPNDLTKMASFLSVVKAHGGTASSTSLYGHGSAGTIYLKHANSLHGGLIIDNNLMTSSAFAYKTEFVAATDNSNTLFSKISGNEVQVSSAATPFATRVGLYNGLLLHVFGVGDSPNPLDPSHIEGQVTSMTNNSFVTNSDYSGITINSDHKYRIVYNLDHLYLAGNAAVDMAGADLVLTTPNGASCDFVSGSGQLNIPTGSSLLGNSLASVNCLNAGLTGVNSFVNYYLP